MMGISKKGWALAVIIAFVSLAFSAVSQTHNTGEAVPTATLNDLGTRDPGTQRVVLLERFTNTGCGPCTYATQNEQIFTNDYLPDKLAVLKYHVSWPSATDPMYLFNPSEQMGRRNWYGDIGYVPFIKIDGMLQPDYPYTYKAILDAVNTRINLQSPLSMSISGELGATSGSVNITINAIDPPGSNLRLVTVLYENNIDYMSPPGSNGETHFEFTVRDMIPNENGVAIALNQGDTIVQTRTFSIDPSFDRDQLGVVAIVQNWLSKQVVQAASFGFVDLSVSGTDISLSNPSPAEGDMVTVSAIVHNNGEPITNSVVRFYDNAIGGVQIGTDRTTGPISKGGSALVQATWDTSSLGGDHDVFVVVDADKEYWEGDEFNNAASADVFVKPLNDVSAIDIPTLSEGSLYPMGRYSVDGTVRNTGSNPQGAFPVYFELRTIGGFVEQTLYNQNFDGMTDEGWGQIPSSGTWQRGSPLGLSDPLPSSPNCWGTNLVGSPPTLARDYLISPPLALPSGSPSITLKFWQYTDIERFFSDPNWLYTDSAHLWTSVDFGASWQRMATYTGDEGFVWVEHTFDLTPFAGQTIVYAFEIVTDSGDWNPPTGELGWYIDDVSVVAMVPEEIVVIGPLRMDTSGTMNSMDVQAVNYQAKLVPGGQLKAVLRTELPSDTYPNNDEFSKLINMDPNHYIYDLIPGWNLISLPLTPASGDPDTVLATIAGKWDVLRYYDVFDETDHWKEYSIAKSYNDMPQLTEKMAIWIHMKEAAVLNLTGSIPSATDIQLRKGWNFVGYPSLYDRDLLVALSNPDISKVEAFDPGAPPTFLRQLSASDMMLTEDGYWVFADRATTWTVGN